jgi:hypothetical protein
MPASVDRDTACTVMVRQTRSGEVTSTNITICNGDEAVRRSIEAAVMRASPLPEPSSPDLFQAELRITLRPDSQGRKSGTATEEQDLSTLDPQTRQSIETACVGDFTRGPAPYRKCVERQLQSIAGAGEAPDLSRLDPQTRQSIETACVGDFTRGPAPYHKCIKRQLTSIDGTDEPPDLSGLDPQTRQSIETACVGDFTRGPAPYRKCIERQLRSIGVYSE